MVCSPHDSLFFARVLIKLFDSRTSMIKELLNALAAMDELMGSNEINMQVAAMTPAVILLVAIRRLFQWLFYSVFRERSSREDIYGMHHQGTKFLLTLHPMYLLTVFSTTTLCSHCASNNIGYRKITSYERQPTSSSAVVSL